MDCNQIRQLLSYEPQGLALPSSPELRRHVETCVRCRSFWCALRTVDEALASRPLASPDSSLAATVLPAVRRGLHAQLASPFSRAFCAQAALVTLVALAIGVVLQRWAGPAGQPGGTTGVPLWIDVAWPNNASAWLSLQSESAAQFVLALVTGIMVTMAGVAIGFKASEERVQSRGGGRSTPVSPN